MIFKNKKIFFSKCFFFHFVIHLMIFEFSCCKISHIFICQCFLCCQRFSNFFVYLCLSKFKDCQTFNVKIFKPYIIQNSKTFKHFDDKNYPLRFSNFFKLFQNYRLRTFSAITYFMLFHLHFFCFMIFSSHILRSNWTKPKKIVHSFILMKMWKAICQKKKRNKKNVKKKIHVKKKTNHL